MQTARGRGLVRAPALEAVPLWKVWWLWGLPVIGLVVALSTFADRTWLAGAPRTAAFAEVLRLAVYWYWCRLAWRSAMRAPSVWTTLARISLAVGLVTVVLT